jgi:anti-sigma regulatory factor (Ser/Thr protein kinase)
MPYYECPGCGLTVHNTAAYSSASVCPNCSTLLPTGARRFVAPGERRDVSRVLDASPDAAAAARHTVVGMPLREATRGDLELIVSELVTNALLYGGRAALDPITLEIAYEGDRVRIAVHDCGSGFTPPALEARDPLRAGGRGCVIVEALSEAWGVDCDDDGCTVWCEVEIDDEPTARAGDYGLAMEMARPGEAGLA